ncbi:MAG: ADP-polyphosphate phosphotransferase [Sedimentisphaeraceae bacterium JB056]
MPIDINNFRIKPDIRINIEKLKTSVEPFYESKKDYKKLLSERIEILKTLQSKLYAHSRYSILLIFQAMDAGGKDSAIKHVMSGVNPQGCQVFSFKEPGNKELKHDFLWRSNLCLPERGMIGIFNRSYYEEVLIAKVHPEILNAQMLPDEIANSKDIWKNRYESIKCLESHLYNNGTRVIKFMLNISKQEQKKRFLSRINNPKKNWKFSQSDIDERQFWPEYMDAYEKCINSTTSKNAPWYVVPADDKKNARLIISEIMIKTLESLDIHYPEPTQKQKDTIINIGKKLKDME